MPKQNKKNEQKFSIFGQSDVGMRCMINSDCIEFDQTKGIAILTDGLEQSEAGKISAKLAAKSVFEGLRSDTFTNDLPSSNEEQVLNAIDKLLSKTNQVLIDASKAVGEENYMRTTIVAILIRKRKIFLGHVGDSRVYLLRNNILETTATATEAADQIKRLRSVKNNRHNQLAVMIFTLYSRPPLFNCDPKSVQSTFTLNWKYKN